MLGYNFENTVQIPIKVKLLTAVCLIARADVHQCLFYYMHTRPKIERNRIEIENAVEGYSF